MKFRVAKNEHLSDTSPWTWHKLPSGQIAEFSAEVQTGPTMRDLKRADPHIKLRAIQIPAGIDPDSCLPKDPPVEFPDEPPHDENQADALWFKAYWGDKRFKCLISYEVLAGPTCNSPDEAKRAFEKEKQRIHKAAEAEILAGRGQLKDKAFELWIRRI